MVGIQYLTILLDLSSVCCWCSPALHPAHSGLPTMPSSHRLPWRCSSKPEVPSLKSQHVMELRQRQHPDMETATKNSGVSKYSSGVSD